MGKVAVLFKVYTDEGKEESVSKEISEKLKPQGVQVEDIAFGIKVVKVLFVHDDSEGSSVLEDHLRRINGVREVEVSEESLI